MKRTISFVGLLILCVIVILIVRLVMAPSETIGVFPVAVIIDHRNGHAFVANYGSNTISMIATNSGAIIQTTAVPKGPLALAIDEKRSRLIVVSKGRSGLESYVSVVDAKLARVLHKMAFSNGAAANSVDRETSNGAVAVSVDEETGHAFILNVENRTVSMIDSMDGHLVRTIHINHFILPRPINAFGFGLNDNLTYYGLGTVEREIGVNEYGHVMAVQQSPQGLAIDPYRHRGFIVATSASSVIEFDTRNGALLHTIHVGLAPCAIAIDPQTGDGFVTNLDDDSVSVLDTRRGIVRHTIAVGHEPGPVAFDSRRARLIVGNLGDGTLSIVNIHRLMVERTVNVGAGLNALAVDQATGRIVAATLTADSVRVEFPTQPAQAVVLDPASGHPVQTLSINDGPEAVAIDETRGRAILITAENFSLSKEWRSGSLRTPEVGWMQTLQQWLPFLAWRKQTPSQVIGSVVDINLKQKAT